MSNTLNITTSERQDKKRKIINIYSDKTNIARIICDKEKVAKTNVFKNYIKLYVYESNKTSENTLIKKLALKKLSHCTIYKLSVNTYKYESTDLNTLINNISDILRKDYKIESDNTNTVAHQRENATRQARDKKKALLQALENQVIEKVAQAQ